MVAPPLRYGMVNYDAGGDLGIKGFIASTEEISVNTEPRSYKEAIKSINFKQCLNAMKEEI